MSSNCNNIDKQRQVVGSNGKVAGVKVQDQVTTSSAASGAEEKAPEKVSPLAPLANIENVPAELQEVAKNARVDNFKKIGSGSFGKVYLVANSAEPNRKFALKIANIKGVMTSERLAREVAVLKLTSDQPSFLTFYGSWAFEADQQQGLLARVAMKMEYAPFDLFEVAGRLDNVWVPLELLRRLARHLIDGVKFLHAKGIVHHDIKGDNIMVHTPSGLGIDDIGDLFAELLQATFKIIDFGGIEIVGEATDQTTAQSSHRAGTRYIDSLDKFRMRKDRAHTYNPFLADAYAVGCVLFSVAESKAFRWVDDPKSCGMWQSAHDVLKRAEQRGNLGELTGSRLLALMYRLLADQAEDQVFISTINDDAF